MLSILKDVLQPTEAAEIRTQIATFEFEDGRSTAGFRAKRVKFNEQMKRNQPDSQELKQRIMTSLTKHPDFRTATFAKSIRPLLISRYKPGMSYGLHVDDPLMGKDKKERTDLAMTLFLSDPKDYQGGELRFHSPWGAHEVKLPAGSAVVYPASTLHRVLPVTSGERIAAVTWIESYLRDPAQRELLAELDRIRRYLHEKDPDSEASNLAFKTFANLMRMWAHN
ncbi:MAG TPA: Fe2+-dependent dioxygenase [Kiloniellales bacterium]|nr:Fe2+-dependent dioxygenase [Kiloniellales bacterium]